MTALELQLEQTRPKLRRLSSAVEQLEATTPQRTKTWLEPREFAQLMGFHARAVCHWRRTGLFRPISIRKNGRGYQFHTDWALADAQEVSKRLRLLLSTGPR